MALLPDCLPAGQVELRRSRTELAVEVADAVRHSFVELNRWMDWAQALPTVDALRQELARSEDRFEADEEWQYSMFEVESTQLVGGAALHMRAEDTAETGYWVRTDRTRRGYATSSAWALTDAAFLAMPHLDRVEMRMDSANAASVAVPRRLGFRLLGEVERELRTPGHTGLGYVWELDRRTWERRRPGAGPLRS